MFTTSDVLRFADRWFDPTHPDSIDRQSALVNCLVLVAIFHVVMSIAFVKMQEWEHKHARHAARTVEIVFAPLMVAPPELHKQIDKAVPLAPVLIPYEHDSTGSKAGAKKSAEQEAAELKRDENVVNKIDKLQLPTVTEKITPVDPIKALAEPVSANPIKQIIQDPVQLVAISQGSKVDHDNDPGKLSDQETDNEGDAEHGAGDSVGIDGSLKGNYGTTNAPPGNAIGKDNTTAEPQKRDIAPYRKDLLLRIAREWHPPKNHPVNLVVWMIIAKDGRLLMASIVASDTNKRIERQTLESIQRTEFAPLPDWYKTEQLSFKIDLRNYE